MRARLLSALAACAATAAVAGMAAAPASAATQAAAHGRSGSLSASVESMLAAAARTAAAAAGGTSHHAAKTPAAKARPAEAAQSATVQPQTTAPAGSLLPALVSSTPASYTPNVSAPGSCNKNWLGSTCDSIVNDIAVVDGEAVVVGAFTQACAPGSGASDPCASGTTVTRDDIFAYNVATGAIDQSFVPSLSGGPVNSVVAGPDNTVYIGGDFTQVDGAGHAGVAQISVSSGQLVSGFTGQVTGSVNSLALSGNSLYVGGQFTAVDGAKSTGLARLNATTGANDSSFSFTLGDPASGTALQVATMAVSPTGGTLVVGGSFLQVNGHAQPRVALINTGGALGAQASLADWLAPLFNNNCSKQHNYVEGIDYAPSGAFFVVADTGYRSANSGPAPCDAAIRFNTGTSGADVTPAWMDFTGGDSLHSVAVAGSVVYVGGHERWVNNECGLNVECERNAVLVNGVAALDANTGLALPWWMPGTTRGTGVSVLAPVPAGSGFSGGLLLGTDVTTIGGSYHGEEALFPLTTSSTPGSGGPIPSGMFKQGRIGGSDETLSGTAEMCLDDANDAAKAGNKVQFWQCLSDASQNWTMSSGDTITINGMCLSVAGSWGKGKTPTNGTKVQLWGCNGSLSQEWKQGSGNTLVSQFGGKCLDDPSSSLKNGTQLQIWSCNGRSQQGWPLPAAQAPPAPPAVGTLNTTLVSPNDNVLCADDNGNATTPGSAVLGQECTEDAEQAWTAQTNGTIQIHGLCLDTQGGGTSSGTAVVIDSCSGGSSQTWKAGTDNELINGAASGECLTDPQNTSGGALEITSCNGSKSQGWWLPKV